jgi:glycerophosphoryl diester phosphodiesterase
MMSARILGHRGSRDQSGTIRENTVDAFALSRRLGADGIELDVHRTVDGAMAVHHDPVIPGVGTIAELTLDVLPDYVPDLATVLRSCAGLFVNIEIKNLPGQPGFDPDDRLAHLVARLVSSMDRNADTIVSSFWPPTLEAVRASDETVATGLLLASWFDPLEAVDAATSRGCRAIHPVISLVSADLVSEAHEAGLEVAAWTVNRSSDVSALASLGVDTMISDDVAMVLATLATEVTEP